MQNRSLSIDERVVDKAAAGAEFAGRFPPSITVNNIDHGLFLAPQANDCDGIGAGNAG
jgi:hypothetical protein